MVYDPQQGQSYPPYGAPVIQAESDNDKLMAALSYILYILMGVIILATDMKNKPFLKFHAYQSITFGIAIMVGWVICFLLSFVFIGICLVPVLLILPFIPAYLAYSKGVFKLPLITDLTYNLFKDCPRPQF